MNAYDSFRALHRGNRILLLANAWDAVSAALFAAAGSPAIATTSAGLAWSCGYADGDALPRASLLSVVEAICMVVGDKPVSVDIEGGYSDSPDDVADLVAQLCGYGVAGINLEDGDGTPENLTAKIAAVKARVRAMGADVFVNARADVFLRDLASGSQAVRETVERGKRYSAAGADGFFVPALKERDDIHTIASAIDLPINVLAVTGLPPTEELYDLGVRRISAGSAIAKLALGAARDAAKTFLRNGDCNALFSESSIDYAQTNALLRS